MKISVRHYRTVRLMGNSFVVHAEGNARGQRSYLESPYRRERRVQTDNCTRPKPGFSLHVLALAYQRYP